MTSKFKWDSPGIRWDDGFTSWDVLRLFAVLNSSEDSASVDVFTSNLSVISSVNIALNELAELDSFSAIAVSEIAESFGELCFTSNISIAPSYKMNLDIDPSYELSILDIDPSYELSDLAVEATINSSIEFCPVDTR